MGCSPPGFSVRAILQARLLEWVTILSPAYITTHYSYQLGNLICRNTSWSSFQTNLGTYSTFLLPSVSCDIIGHVWIFQYSFDFENLLYSFVSDLVPSLFSFYNKQ